METQPGKNIKTESVNDKIELRSEKVRKRIGDIPPSLIGLSIVVTVMVFLIFFAAICFIPYPYANGETIIQHILK